MNKKLDQLVRVLKEKSGGGRVQWSEVIEDVFRTTVAGSIFRISRSYPEVGEDDQTRAGPVFEITVVNPFGKIVEEEAVTDRDVEYPSVEELFKVARRSAHSADQVLDSMLSVISGSTS